MVRHLLAPPDLRGDGANVLVLIFFYILQGIPLGLAAAIPLTLTKLGTISYKEQAQFSFAFWPFSLKLLWAPIVDSCFFAKIGRRKTWLVPVQYAIGILMIFLSRNVNSYMGVDNGSSVDILHLTGLFFALNFLAATQDIAVDGWALTMLQERNASWASTCNSIGQTAGFFLGFAFYLGLEAWNLVDLPGFLFFWGLVFMGVTTIVAMFKTEDTTSKAGSASQQDDELSLGQSYMMLWRIIRLPHMPPMLIFLMTAKIMFAATDSVSSLKLVERGVSKDVLALISIPLMPVQVVLPYILSRYTAGERPLDLWIWAAMPRLLCGLVVSYFIYLTPSFGHVSPEDGQVHFPALYYAAIMAIVCIQQIFVSAMFVAIMAFFARISDPAVGGTYMTLLNTLTNLGGNWPSTLALWFVEKLTVKRCSVESVVNNGERSDGQTFGSTPHPPPFVACQDSQAVELCKSAGGECSTVWDGFYIECLFCFLFGCLWLALFGRRTVEKIQSLPVSQWRVVPRGESENKNM